MRQQITTILLRPKSLTIVYALLAVVAGVQAILIGTHVKDGHVFTDYNNYIIFRNSFRHLIAGKDLYVLYLDEQADLYKYSPAFALIMAPFSALPDWLGLPVWNAINALVLLIGIRMLPFPSRTQSVFAWLVALELLTSLQNAQSNGLMAGLMLIGFGYLNRDKTGAATLMFVLSGFVKIYGGFACLLFVFYPNKTKAVGYTLLWAVLLAIIPMVVTSPPTLMWQYHNWLRMLAADKAASYGLSVLGWLHSWFGIDSGKNAITMVGFLLLLLPLARTRLYKNPTYRLLYLADILVWIIIFNYKAESPTFIIALTGIAIRQFALPRSLRGNILLGVVFVFTCLSPTDLFPTFIRQHFFIPYTIKAIPCIIAWAIITIDLLRIKPENETAARATKPSVAPRLSE